MNYLAIIFTTLLFILSITFMAGLLVSAADFSKDLDSRLKDHYVSTHIRKYRKKIFYGK